MAHLSPTSVLVTWLCLATCTQWMTTPVNGYTFTSWSQYWNSWIQEPYYPTFYPCGVTYGDTSESDLAQGFAAEINFTVPYYGRTYRDIFVGVEGILQLTMARPAGYEMMSTGGTWPEAEWPNAGDPAFLGLYYSGFQMYANDGAESINWRILDPRDDVDNVALEVTEQMLWTISLDVRAHVVGSEHFRAKYGMVVTYANMTYYGCPLKDACPRNTLQVAFVTDEIRTYAVYNYYNMTWVGSTIQNCDPNTGNASSSYPDCWGPAIGFNAGQARGFTPMTEFCYQQDAYNMDRPEYQSIPDVRGRYMWEVSSYQLVRGGCTNISSWDWTKWPMEISPSVGNMLGGDPMYISGPCFTTDNIANIQCDFNGTVVPANLVPHNMTKALCMPPVLFGKGNVSVSLSMDAGSTWKYKTSYFLMQPGTMPALVSLVDESLWFMSDPTYLTITWDPMSILFSWEVDMVDPANLYVSIQLFAYLEWDNGNGIVSDWWALHDFESDFQNTGTYTFYTNSHGCQNVDECNWGVPIPVGVMCVGRITEPYKMNNMWTGLPGPEGQDIYKRIWSDVVSIGWYISYGLNQTQGNSWAVDLCNMFYWAERNQDWTNSTSPCPYTKDHAMVDPRFLLAENCNHSYPSCANGTDFSYTGMRYEDCFYQVAQAQGKSNWTGASKCCYNKDGTLMYAGDSVDGGESSKASRFGIAPYGKPMTVPVLSHWVWDMSYKMLCCNWTGDASYCMGNYMANRPTRDAHDYQPMGSALAYGDPHFLTFGYVNYTFNGMGEYWLLYANTLWGDYNMQVQARFAQPNNQSWGETWATTIQAVAAQEGLFKSDNLPIIEAVLDYPDGSGRILILVDGFVQNFSLPQKSVQEYMSRDRKRKTTVVCNDCITAGRQKNFTMVFQNGVTVQVAAVRNTIQCRVSVPTWPYFKMTAGLLGWWNEDSGYDLRRPDGFVISPDQSLQSLEQSFGAKWEITEDMSLFTYRMMLDYNWWRYPSFQPYYSIPPPSDTSNYSLQSIYDTCGDNFPCAYDYSVMNNYYMGVEALNAYSRQQGVYNRSFMERFCPYLQIRNAIREPCDNRAGSVLKFTGCLPGWHLTGHNKYNCYIDSWDVDGYWWPRPNTYCMGTNWLVAATVIPILVILLLLLFILWYCCYYKKSPTSPPAASSTQTTTQTTTQGRPPPGSLTIGNPTPIHNGNSNTSYTGSKQSLSNEMMYKSSQPELQVGGKYPYNQDDSWGSHEQPNGYHSNPDIPRDDKRTSSESSVGVVHMPYTESSQVFYNPPKNTQSKMIIRTVPASAVNRPPPSHRASPVGVTNGAPVTFMAANNSGMTQSNSSINRTAYNPAAPTMEYRPAPPPPRYVVYRDPTGRASPHQPGTTHHQPVTLHIPPSPDTDV